MSKAVIPSVYQGLRVVSAAEMAEVDKKATRDLGIPALLLMENAGKAVAKETQSLLAEKGKDPKQASVSVCCGRGNNGADGLVAARLLRQAGCEVAAFLAPPRRGAPYGVEFAEMLRRATAAGVSAREMGEETAELDIRLGASDVVLDALLGTGSSGKPSGAVHVMIQRMMKSARPIVAVDIPSGIHPDTGYHSGVFVTAAVTVTFGLPKKGLLAPHAQKNVGRLVVADIGFPKSVLGEAT
ncbi:MAG: NAD(P)H-hydrate epimerase [Elusimicrobia bacterium]|nr:NAD(P)H-hydrate epimerase [Elusimicrobiota bacterium]